MLQEHPARKPKKSNGQLNSDIDEDRFRFFLLDRITCGEEDGFGMIFPRISR